MRVGHACELMPTCGQADAHDRYLSLDCRHCSLIMPVHALTWDVGSDLLGCDDNLPYRVGLWGGCTAPLRKVHALRALQVRNAACGCQWGAALERLAGPK